MSEKATWPNKKGLTKKIKNKTYFLGKSWDIVHGRGYFCQVFNDKTFKVGFGFHKTNKFTAIKLAEENLFFESLKIKHDTSSN